MQYLIYQIKGNDVAFARVRFARVTRFLPAELRKPVHFDDPTDMAIVTYARHFWFNGLIFNVATRRGQALSKLDLFRPLRFDEVPERQRLYPKGFEPVSSDKPAQKPAKPKMVIKIDSGMRNALIQRINVSAQMLDQSSFKGNAATMRDAMDVIRKSREALLRVAPSFHGVDSAAAKSIADALGIEFPIDFAKVESIAELEGYDLDDLWSPPPVELDTAPEDTDGQEAPLVAIETKCELMPEIDGSTVCRPCNYRTFDSEAQCRRDAAAPQSAGEPSNA